MESLYKKHIIATVLLSIFVIVLILAVLYFMKEMREKETRVLEAKQHLASYSHNKKVFLVENQELQEIAKEIEALEKYNVTEEQIPQLLSSLEAMAANNNIVFAIGSVDTPKPTNQNKALSISFSAGGSYEDIQTFLDKIMHQAYQARVVSFSFFKNAASDNIQASKIEEPEWEFSGTIEIMSF